MKIRATLIVLVTIALIAGGCYAAYRLGMSRGMGMSGTSVASTAAQSAPAASTDSSTLTISQGEAATRRHIKDGIKAGDLDPVMGRSVLYYHDPMVPGRKFEAPAKSPFMDMMLVPVYAGTEGTDSSQVTVSPRIQQNLGVRTAEVVEGILSPQFSAVGSIAWNERDQVVVQARATSYVERLHARATLDRVAKGQPLAELYVPDWVAAQEEFLALRRTQGGDLATLVDAARARMRQSGMAEAQIALVEASSSVQSRITITAPIGGVVTEVMAREGMTVTAGATLFRINGTGTVWAHAEVPESQVALLRPGTRAQARSPARPGETFEGHVQTLLPEVNPTTRTLKARLEIANRGGRLVPGMFVQMQFMDIRAEKALLIPSEAVIQTGQRAVVILADDGGKFRPVMVEVGIESDGQTEIKRGLAAGQRVVVSSQFLIDSEASLRSVEARLNVPETGAAPTTHSTAAVIEAIKGDTVTLSHPPIASLKWPAMTMDFKLPPASQQAPGLAIGKRVNAEFLLQEGAAPQITRMRLLEPETVAPRSKP